MACEAGSGNVPARPSRQRKSALYAGLLLCALPLLQAGADEPACDPRAREFDFWIGDWEVTNVDGSVAGHSLISPILDDCILQEHWSGISGSAGTSLNFFDPGRGRWRQFWVWREGTTLELEGGLLDGAMVMEGRSQEDGVTVLNRLTWIDNVDDTVTQRWEVSRDDGETWTTIFTGRYRRADQRR